MEDVSRIVTYSPAFTLVPTYECFNRCTYCNFRVNPGDDVWLTLDAAQGQLEALQTQNVSEILILSGEVHPHSSRRGQWVEHIYRLCELALSMGFLPHTNVGPLSYAEMRQLKQVNVSMGLMLEQMTPHLLETVHRHAPSKIPRLRIQQLGQAGELRIPFTTGLLLGLGETEQDRQDTLREIALVHQKWGHIQEVILQPYVTGQKEEWSGTPFALETLVETVAIARQLLPPDIVIQIPPNLVNEPEPLLACLEAGARDLGGIVPVDHVNPDYHHGAIAALRQTLQGHGWILQPRLPLYPHLDHWIPEPLGAVVRHWRKENQQPS